MSEELGVAQIALMDDDYVQATPSFPERSILGESPSSSVLDSVAKNLRHSEPVMMKRSPGEDKASPASLQEFARLSTFTNPTHKKEVSEPVVYKNTTLRDELKEMGDTSQHSLQIQLLVLQSINDIMETMKVQHDLKKKKDDYLGEIVSKLVESTVKLTEQMHVMQQKIGDLEMKIEQQQYPEKTSPAASSSSASPRDVRHISPSTSPFGLTHILDIRTKISPRQQYGAADSSRLLPKKGILNAPGNAANQRKVNQNIRQFMMNRLHPRGDFNPLPFSKSLAYQNPQ